MNTLPQEVINKLNQFQMTKRRNKVYVYQRRIMNNQIKDLKKELKDV